MNYAFLNFTLKQKSNTKKAKIRYSGSNQNNPFQKYILWKVQNCYLTGTVWFNLFEGDQYILDTTIWNAWIDEELGKFFNEFFFLSWSWNVISEINRKKFMEIRTWNCFFRELNKLSIYFIIKASKIHFYGISIG